MQTKILGGAIHRTQSDDRVPPIILASQRREPEQKSGHVHAQYSE